MKCHSQSRGCAAQKRAKQAQKLTCRTSDLLPASGDCASAGSNVFREHVEIVLSHGFLWFAPGVPGQPNEVGETTGVTLSPFVRSQQSAPPDRVELSNSAEALGGELTIGL